MATTNFRCNKESANIINKFNFGYNYLWKKLHNALYMEGFK